MVDEKYQMKDGESIDDYMIRASALGQQNRLTWQEIADIINEETDLSFSESKYRKNYRTYCKGVEAGARSAESEYNYMPPANAVPMPWSMTPLSSRWLST